VTLLLIDAANPDRTAVEVDDAHPERAVGWERKPEGLCRDDVCVPLPPGDLDLAGVAAALGRPLVIDETAGVAAMGEASARRGQALASGLAPDFTLPDLSGRLWSLSDFRGRKVVLYVYASW
jgi:hypothetical protein